MSVLILWLLLPAAALADTCVMSEPWPSVQAAWYAAWDRPMALEGLEGARTVSVQAGLPSHAVHILSQTWQQHLAAQVLALVSAMVLLASWWSVRRGGWRGAILAFGLAAGSLGFTYAASDVQLVMRRADLRTSPSGAAAVVDQVPMGSVGRCVASSTDPTFCFWEATSGAQGWIEMRTVVSLTEICREH